MKKGIKIFLLIIIFVSISNVCFAKFSLISNIMNRIIVNPRSLREEYRFRIGDKIKILTNIEGEHDEYITIKTKVDRSGYIVFNYFKPFVIYAKDLSIETVENKIRKCFKIFHRHICVSISVKYSIDFILESYIKELYEMGKNKETLTEVEIIRYRELIKSLADDKENLRNNNFIGER